LTDATARERLGEILQRAAVGIAQMDTTGRYVLVNDRYCDMLGRTRPEGAGDHDGAANDTGSVTIDWSITGGAGDARFHLSWKERGGPAVSSPTSRRNPALPVVLTSGKLTAAPREECKQEPLRLCSGLPSTFAR
jgi:hypothetical protein